MSLKFLLGKEAVKTPFAIEHPTISLGVLFTEESGKILNPDVVVGDGSLMIIF